MKKLGLALALALAFLGAPSAAHAAFLPPLVCTGVIAVNQIASTDLHTFTNKGQLCAIVLISATQQGLSLAEGTGTTCGTGTSYLMGGAGGTVEVAANGGWSATGSSPYLKMQVTGDHLCLIQSGTGNISGFITYADAP